MTLTLQASPRVRRGVFVASLVLVVVEVSVFAMLWRHERLVDPGGDRHQALLFLALGTAATLQAMAVVGVAWVFVAMSRTVLAADITGVSLDHPWRSWHGAWADIAHAWTQSGWLVLQVRGQWRRWYVRVGPEQAELLAELRRQLPSGAWLEGSARQMHLARTTLPMVLAATGVGGLILLWAFRMLDTLQP